MDLEKLLKKIKEVENDISIIESLKAVLGEKDENERCAGISYRGNWTVYFKSFFLPFCRYGLVHSLKFHLRIEVLCYCR